MIIQATLTTNQTELLESCLNKYSIICMNVNTANQWCARLSAAGSKKVVSTATSEKWWCRLTLTVPWTFTDGTSSSSTKAESCMSDRHIFLPSPMLRTKPWREGTKTLALLSQVDYVWMWYNSPLSSWVNLWSSHWSNITFLGEKCITSSLNNIKNSLLSSFYSIK